MVAVAFVFSSSRYKISRPAMHSKSRNEAATKGPQKHWTAVAVVSVVSGDGEVLVSVSLSESLDDEFGSSLQYIAHTLNTHARHNYDETR